jgi:hypothetical protein
MDRLRVIYGNPATTSKNKRILAERAGTTQAEADRFLKSLAAVQVTKKAAPSKILYVPTTGVKGSYACDTMYLKDYAKVNQKRMAIFVVIHVNTRYAYCRALTSVTSGKTAQALESIIKEINADEPWKRMTVMRCDAGAENRGELEMVLKKHKIEQNFLEARTHERLARLDRFVGTLRQLIGEVFATNNNNVWYKHLDAIVKNYNHRTHDSLTKLIGVKTSPAQVSQSDETRIQLHDAKLKEEIRTKVPNYPPGTHVRLLMRRTSEGAKALKLGTKLNDQTYTSQVYQIVDRVGVNSYSVNTTGNDPKIFPYHALQVVDMAKTKPQPAPKKVNKRVVSAQRLEAQNISVKEQKGNMVAARTRGSKVATRSTKKVSYRSMVGLK